MPEHVALCPDGPHSPEVTAKAGDLFDRCSRFLVYATMSEKAGLHFPADAYRLVADLYAATGRMPQICGQLEQFLRAQEAEERLYEARGEPVPATIERAAGHLRQAADAARTLTRLLQAVQADIAGLGVEEASTDA